MKVLRATMIAALCAVGTGATAGQLRDVERSRDVTIIATTPPDVSLSAPAMPDVTEPMTTEPESTEPETTESVTTEPATTEPATTAVDAAPVTDPSETSTTTTTEVEAPPTGTSVAPD